MARGLETFLDGLGALRPRDRRRAARTAARAWARELAAGQHVDPAAFVRPIAGNGRSPEVVWIEGIPLHAICPHHLLPVRGVAHVAYVPGDGLAPLGQVARLVQAAASRLILQEDLAELIASSLERATGAPGTACVVEASHDCMSARGPRALSATARVLARRGTLARGPLARKLLGRWERA
ncbi:MAG: GTP cyclohydrolase I [Acidobacteriota bacterium]